MTGYSAYCRILEIDSAPLAADEPSHVHVVRPSRRGIPAEGTPLPLSIEPIVAQDETEAA